MKVAETYRDRFGYELSFTSLYGIIIKHTSNLLSTEIIPKVLVCTKCVKTLVYAN